MFSQLLCYPTIKQVGQTAQTPRLATNANKPLTVEQTDMVLNWFEFIFLKNIFDTK